jgi:hypothetical protein
MKKVLIVLLSIALLSSCGAKVDKNRVATDAKNKANATASPNGSLSASPSSAPTLEPTKFNDPRAVGLFTQGDLKGYTVAESAGGSISDSAKKVNDSYNSCLGANAPDVALVNPETQFEGDRYSKNGNSDTNIFISSVVVNSKTPQADVEYLNSDKNHGTCLEDYIMNISKLRGIANPPKVTYSNLSFKDGLLISKIAEEDVNGKPGLNIILLTIPTKTHVIQYQINAISKSAKDRDSVVQSAIAELTPVLISKANILN